MLASREKWCKIYTYLCWIEKETQRRTDVVRLLKRLHLMKLAVKALQIGEVEMTSVSLLLNATTAALMQSIPVAVWAL